MDRNIIFLFYLIFEIVVAIVYGRASIKKDFILKSMERELLEDLLDEYEDQINSDELEYKEVDPRRKLKSNSESYIEQLLKPKIDENYVKMRSDEDFLHRIIDNDQQSNF